MKQVEVDRAVFWNMKEFDESGSKRDKALSDAFIETRWIQTDRGKEELRLRCELKGLERLTMAIKNSIVVASIEARNNA
jgi:hypothetical protein